MGGFLSGFLLYLYDYVKMKDMKRVLATLLILMAMCFSAGAELALRNPCADNMVLQQQTEAVVWGFARPGATVSVSPSWGGSCSAKTGSDGCWQVRLKTPAASFTNHSIRVAGDGANIIIHNVLVGEVWFASGQSNMQMPLSGWPSCPIKDCNEVLSAPAQPDLVRMFNISMDESLEPVREAEGKWLKDVPSERDEMSATAYFFARKIASALGVPVGIVNCSYGGTMLECWASKELCASWGLPVDDESIMARSSCDRQSTRYNKMLAPCIGYTVKGFLWYQGCSNVGRCEHYAERFADMIAHWRQSWGLGEIPVYLVEIAPFVYGGNNSQYLREQQWLSAQLTPSCAVVPTNDLVYEYETFNIHPSNKQEVGARLAWLALNRDYGMNGIKCYAPTVQSVFRSRPGEIALKLENARNGFLRTRGIEGLEVAGPDGTFLPVKAFRFDADSQTMYIRSEIVPDPVCVRYCWGDWVIGNIIGCDGLPLQTFCRAIDNE